MKFEKATKKQAKLRMAIHGPSGAGKTFTALRIASAMGKRIALIDTERGSASKYSDKFDFDVLEIFDDYNPQRLFEAMRAAEGYDCLVVDSLTHFWNGPGGFLAMIDDEVKKQKARNNKPDSFTAWKVVDPLYQHLIQTILGTPFHFFCTLRAKTEYEKTEGENGKKGSVKKVGMAPQMRNDFEYEFDVEGMMDIEHHLAIGKTRCEALDNKVFTKPGEDIAKILLAWLNDGAVVPPKRLEPPPVESKPQEPTLPDNPEQQAALDGFIARLIDADAPGILIVKDEAKSTLKGAFITRFQAEYNKRYKQLNAS